MNTHLESLARRILMLNNDDPLPNLQFDLQQDEPPRHLQEIGDYTRRIDFLDKFIKKKFPHPDFDNELNLFYLDDTYNVIHDIGPRGDAMVKWKSSYDDLLDAMANLSQILINEPDNKNVLLPLMSHSFLNSIRFARDSLHEGIASSKPKIDALTKTIKKATYFYTNPRDPDTRDNLLDSCQRFLDVSVDQKKIPSNLDFIRDSIVVALMFAATLALAYSIYAALFVLALSLFKVIAIFTTLSFCLPAAMTGTAMSFKSLAALLEPKPELTNHEKTAFKTATPFINACGPTKHHFFSGKLYLQKETWSPEDLGEYTPPIVGYMR